MTDMRLQQQPSSSLPDPATASLPVARRRPGIYLDYAATTPVDPRVVRVMNEFLTVDGVFGNPASTTHGFGQAVAQAVESARQETAALLSSSPEEIVWTSGATESIKPCAEGGGSCSR